MGQGSYRGRKKLKRKKRLLRRYVVQYSYRVTGIGVIEAESKEAAGRLYAERFEDRFHIDNPEEEVAEDPVEILFVEAEESASTQRTSTHQTNK